MDRFEVCDVADLAPGERLVTRVKRHGIVVINSGGEFFVLLDRCPHQAAPLSHGVLCGTTLATPDGQYEYAHEDRVLRCPWHGWEFDISSGQSLAEQRIRTRTYRTAVENGRVVVYV